jgi:hypothetical protein
MTKPDNTSADVQVNALGMLAMGSDYILGQEAAGQRQLVNSTWLPTKANDGDEPYLALGFTFGQPDPGDRLFRPATLPEGWSKQGSDHSMWSYVVDEFGRRRVAVFYKAAFYDRDAFMRLETLYGYANKLEYDGDLPIYGGDWCTRELFAEQVAAIRRDRVKRTDEYRGYATDESRTNASWFAEHVGELEAELAKHDAWAAKVAAS